jgi:hypothetical protein
LLSTVFDYNYEFEGITINTNRNRITFTDEEIQSFTITESVCSDNKLSVGNVISSTLDLSLINIAYIEGTQSSFTDEDTGETFYYSENEVGTNENLEDKNFIGTRLEVIATYSGVEYPLGIFFVTSCTTTGMITRMQASNKFDTITYEYLYKTGLDWSKSHTIKEIIEDLSSVDNLRDAINVDDIITTDDEKNGIDKIKIKKEPDKYTLRQMLSFCIAVFAFNAKQKRDDENKVQFVKFDDRDTVNAELKPEITYYDALTYEEEDSKITCMVGTVKDDTTYKGNTEASSDEYLSVQLEADVEIFDFNATDYLWNIMGSKKYRAYNWQGVCNPTIECGDVVRIYTDETNYFNSFVFTNQINYNGALTQTLSASTDSTIKNEAVRTGSVASTVVTTITSDEETSNKIGNTVVDTITSDEEMSNKIGNTAVDTITTDEKASDKITQTIVKNITTNNNTSSEDNSVTNTYITQLQTALGVFKVESVTELPETVDKNTIYLIQGEVNVT